MKLSWKPSASASALHAAECLARSQKPIDQRVGDSLHGFADAISLVAKSIGVSDVARFWEPLLAHASQIGNNRELAVKTLSHFLGDASESHSMIPLLAGHITDIEAAFRLLFPKVDEQLPFRLAPLADSWESIGPGLLAHIGRMTEKNLIADRAEVIAVQPIVNGYGAAHPFVNRIRIEAVLVNPIHELPESIRMAWLLSQLKLDLAELGKLIPERRLIPLAGLAMLPPTLAAGKVLDVTEIDESFLDLAIEQWQIAVPSDINVAKILLGWWETYLQTKPDWTVAMTALEKMLVD